MLQVVLRSRRTSTSSASYVRGGIVCEPAHPFAPIIYGYLVRVQLRNPPQATLFTDLQHGMQGPYIAAVLVRRSGTVFRFLPTIPHSKEHCPFSPAAVTGGRFWQRHFLCIGKSV